MTAIEPDRLLASDAEREHTVERLNAAFSEGRLRADEFDDRVSEAFAARTRADLVRLLADLPPSDPAPRSAPTKRPLARRVATVLKGVLCCGFPRSPDRDVDERQVRAPDARGGVR